MTIQISGDLEQFIHQQVKTGLYLSEEEVVRHALEQFRKVNPVATPVPGPIVAVRDAADGPGTISVDSLRKRQEDAQVLQRRLHAVGLLGEIKPPIADVERYRDRRAIPIQGEPLSETIIRERR